MQLSPTIFKAYDVRGVVPSTLNEEVAYALGLAFGTIAQGEGEKTVAVGRDGRLSGPSLSAALVQGPAGIRHGCDRHRACDHAHALLCGQHPVRQRHPGDRQPQPEGLQRLQDGDGRTRHLRRGNPGPAQPDGAGRAAVRAARHRAQHQHPGALPRPHRAGREARPSAEDRRRFGQRHRGRFGARHLPRAGLRSGRALQRSGRHLPQPPPGPEQAREPEGPDRGDPLRPAPNWAWPSTATATVWASSPAAATTSTRIAR